MHNLYFSTDSEFDFYLSSLHKLGSGTEGTCYLDSHNQVLKKYHLPLFKNENDIERLLKFAHLDMPAFKFIRNLIYVEQYIKGTVTSYAPGSSLNLIPLHNYLITSIITSISTLKEDVKKISQEGIMVSIYHDSNIVYDGISFSFIDTFPFCHVAEETWILYNQNMSAITEILMESLILSSTELSNFLFKVSHYSNYRSDCHFLLNPEELIFALKNELEQYCGFKLEKFNDSKEILQKKLSL